MKDPSEEWLEMIRKWRAQRIITAREAYELYRYESYQAFMRRRQP